MTREGGLWVGHRLYGAFHYNGQTWTRYDARDGLADNFVVTLLQTRDGSIWAGTTSGINRFDGQTWTTTTLSAVTGLPFYLRKSRDGAVWVNLATRLDLSQFPPKHRTVRYAPDTRPPETRITLSAAEVSQPGNTTLAWTGADPWKDTPKADLQFAYRLDNNPWSPFASETSHIFEALSDGPHTAAVKARDRDFNEDPTPAVAHFTVVPPVYKQPWFLALLAVLLSAIGFQTARVVRRERRLQEANTALSSANHDLFRVNQEAETQAREAEGRAAVDRVRAEAAAMQQSTDVVKVVSALWTGLTDTGLAFESCGIQFVNEPAGVLTLYAAIESNVLPVQQLVHEDMLMGVDLYTTDIPLDFARERGYAMPGVEPGITPAPDTFPQDLAQIWGVPFPENFAGRDLINVPITDGGIVVIEPVDHRFEPLDLQVARDFAEAVSLGFTRYFDFQRLEGQNQALLRERAVERIRGEVQTMNRAEDFEGVLSLLAADIKTVGISFQTCAIDVLDEPVDEPTMDHFEAHGYRYTAYTIDPEGAVTRQNYYIPSPFPPVNLENIERFIEGEPWQGRSDTTAILDVPISSYGRLRLTATDRSEFTPDDTATLQDFAAAISLGYARYRDFQELEAANLEIQEQTRRKSAFLASMSHELRTPMNAILGFTRMVLRRSGDVLPERQKENLNKVTDAGNHLLEMINDLLDLSKIEAGGMDVEPKPFSVKRLILSCCGLVEPLIEAGVELTYDIADGADEAITDEDKLRHVIGNLLSNARKFTTEGKIAVRARRIHNQLVISVSDTGIGMPEEALETIFDEFQQVQGSDQTHKGTGLGLAITRQYTELLGGTISVESEVGEGSTFTVRIPFRYEG